MGLDLMHYLNTHLQAPARKRFYRLLSRAVRFGWASYDYLTDRCKLVLSVARKRFPVLRHTRYKGCKLKTDFYYMN